MEPDRRGARRPLNESSLPRRAFAEYVGTALLLVAVVGSGIAASRLFPREPGLALLANAASTAGALVALILALGAVSGAHLNPAVSLANTALGRRPPREVAAYVGAQLTGAVTGTVVADVMFGEPAVAWSTTTRSAGRLWFAEGVATFGLVLVIFAVVRSGRASAAPFAVGAYIGGAHFFTASTSFANPAVTVARTLTDTFTGIAPGSAPMYVLAQLAGAAVAVAVVKVLSP